MTRRSFVLAALAGLAGVMFALPLWADEVLLQEIAARVADAPVLRAEFSQTKTLAALRKPFRLAGRFTYAREAGVLWQVDTPYPARYLIGREGMVEIGPDGQHRPQSGREAAGVARAGQILQALLGADLAPLQSAFVLDASRQGEGWRVTLTPRNAELARHLARIELAGHEAVEQVELFEGGGDHTEIRFTAIARDRQLDAAEAALFAR